MIFGRPTVTPRSPLPVKTPTPIAIHRSDENGAEQRAIVIPAPDTRPVVKPAVPTGRQAPTPKTPKPAPPETLTAKHLKDALALAASVVAVRISLPILACVRIGEGRIEATDLEQRLTITLPGLDCAPVCVTLKMLRELSRNLKGDVCMRTEGQTLIVNESFRLLGLDPAEWPGVNEQPTAWPGHFMLPSKSHWDAVMTAMSPDETRPQLCGVCLDIENRRFVTSDGHRLHAVDAQVNAMRTAHKGISRPKTVIIPAIAAKILYRMLSDQVEGQLGYFGIAPTVSWFLRFTTLTTTLMVRVPETADFPDYTQIIPDPGKTTAVTFPRLQLLEAAKACRALYTAAKACRALYTASTNGNHATSGMTLEPGEGGIKAWAEQPDSGRVERLIPAQGWPPHAPGVGFNSRYLLEALHCLQEDSVTLQIIDQNSPVSIYEGPIMIVIMPMRIFPGKVEETAVLKSDEKDMPPKRAEIIVIPTTHEELVEACEATDRQRGESNE